MVGELSGHRHRCRVRVGVTAGRDNLMADRFQRRLNAVLHAESEGLDFSCTYGRPSETVMSAIVAIRELLNSECGRGWQPYAPDDARMTSPNE